MMAERDSDKLKPTSRRAFLRAGLAAGGTALSGQALAAAQGPGNPANQPPNVADWSRVIGDGVAVRAYGKPSKHEAHVIRRDVEWLTPRAKAR